MQKRFAAALIGRVDLHRCITRILFLVLCFVSAVFMVAVLSQTARAANVTSGTNFAETYGLELADGESKEVAFRLPDCVYKLYVTNTTTMEYLFEEMSATFSNFGYTTFYDEVSGQIVVTDDGGNKVDFKVLSDGTELTMKFPSGTTDGMSALLGAFNTVVTLLNIVWTLMLSNPLMLLFLAAGLLVVGVRAFRQLKRAAR